MPAVLAIVLMVLTMVLSSMGVVREKEIGTMEQLIVTPIRPWQLIVGKLRGIFLKGSGLEALWPEAVVLPAFGVTFLTLAALRFRKRLD